MAQGRQATNEGLRGLEGVREQAERILARAEAGDSQHFVPDPAAEDRVAEALAAALTAGGLARLPPLQTVWHALRGGQPALLDRLAAGVQHLDAHERARCGLDLGALAVLLDPSGGASSGFLALCDDYANGLLAAVPGASSPRLEADGLARWLGTEAGRLGDDGHAGRRLLALVGGLRAERVFFGASGRFGLFLDTLLADQRGGAVSPAGVARHLAPLVARLHAGAGGATAVRNLGDVWRLPGLGGPGDRVPFHALLQAMLLVLVEPMGEAELRFDDEAGLGVPETAALARQTLRLGLLRPRHPAVARLVHPPGSDIVVELRALALALTGRLADRARDALGLAPADLPDVRLVTPLARLAASWDRPGPTIAIAPSLF